MRITLKIRTFCSQPPIDPQARVFDSFPIIIGRSNACNYILNDTSRYISSNHGVILTEGDTVVIQDTSANGIYVNGNTQPVGRGHSLVLNHEDTLAIGDYTLIIEVEKVATLTTPDIARDSFSDFPVSSDRPNPVQVSSAFDPFRGDEPDWTPESARTEDPFADDWSVNEVLDAERHGASASNADDSDWSDWPSESGDMNGADFDKRLSSHSKPAASASEADDFDWLSNSNAKAVSASTPRSNDGNSASRAGRAKPQPDRAFSPPGSPFSNSAQSSSANLSHSPPPARRAANRSTPRRNVESASTPSHSLEALLKAASLRPSDFENRDNAEVMEQTGRLLTQMTDAIMVLLQSRMELKNAIRSDVTTLSRSGNNPLKFSYSAPDALTKLLANNPDGYLQSEMAIQEAVEDLKLHQLAMLEGMKSAVKSLLSEFDPDKLADTLGKTGGISANIPITREAKLWQLFCNQYDTICEEAVSDFSDLFGAEFRKAYEKSIEKAGRRPDF